MDNLKEKFTDQSFLEKLPLIGIGLICICVIFSVVMSRVHISQARNELSELQAVVEKEKSEQEQETKEQEQTISALSGGKKVATLETQWSENLSEMMRAQADGDSSDEVAILVDDLQEKNVGISESLAEYFDDDSYRDAWFSGHEMIQHPYWDFGTKYNVSIGEKNVPVVWVCYDSSLGGTVLAYTTAMMNTETGKFTDAKSVMFDVDAQYVHDDSHLHGMLLGLLQGTASDVDIPDVDEVEESADESDESGDVSDSDEDENVVDVDFDEESSDVVGIEIEEQEAAE